MNTCTIYNIFAGYRTNILYCILYIGFPFVTHTYLHMCMCIFIQIVACEERFWKLHIWALNFCKRDVRLLSFEFKKCKACFQEFKAHLWENSWNIRLIWKEWALNFCKRDVRPLNLASLRLLATKCKAHFWGNSCKMRLICKKMSRTFLVSSSRTFLRKSPISLQKEPCIFAKEPCISTKELYFSAQEPYISATTLVNLRQAAHGGDERWGAGVETHFQEISWNLRPVVNGT